LLQQEDLETEKNCKHFAQENSKKTKDLNRPSMEVSQEQKNKTPLFPVTREFQQKPHTNVLIHTVKISKKTIEIA
jgi:hypothetical protein